MQTDRSGMNFVTHHQVKISHHLLQNAITVMARQVYAANGALLWLNAKTAWPFLTTVRATDTRNPKIRTGHFRDTQPKGLVLFRLTELRNIYTKSNTRAQVGLISHTNKFDGANA